MADFDIIGYMQTLTGYPVERPVLERIASERNLTGVTTPEQLSRKDRNLVIADLLFYMFTSPSNTGSRTKSHGNFTVTIGGVIITDKNDIYALMMSLYKNPEQELWEALDTVNGDMYWTE